MPDNDCLIKCDGLFITGFERREFEKDQVEEILSQVRDDYEFYKSTGNLTDGFGGNYSVANLGFIVITVCYESLGKPSTHLHLF